MALLTLTTYGNASAAETRLFSLREGDATVREWNPVTGNFITNLLQLTDQNVSVTTSTDLEFDGTFFYTISDDGPFIRRFDASGRYLDAILLTEQTGYPVLQPQIGLAAFGGYFYTIAPNDPRIRKFDSSGHYLGDVGSLRDSLGLMTRMTAIATDGKFFYTIDAGDPRTGKWDLTGQFIGDVPGFNHTGTPDASNTGIAVQPLPPSITKQPSDVAQVVGEGIGLDVTLDGFQPIALQWFFNGVPILGATSAGVFIPSVDTEDEGSYWVVASNFVGSVTSSVALLQIWTPPVISQQPTSTTVVAGSSASLQTSASGSAPIAYQWYFNGNPLPNARTSTLSFPNVQPEHAGTYSVLVSNVATAFMSDSASLVVLTPPTITTHPTSKGAMPGADISLNVAASGNPSPSIQWYFNGSMIPGATMSTIWLQQVQPTHWGQYFATVSNVVGVETSMVATLWVTNAPVITQQPQSLNAALGSSSTLSADVVSFEEVNYQWFFKNRAISGATGTTLGLQDLRMRSAGYYRLEAWNSIGAVASQDVMLRVYRPVKLIVQPRSASVIAGRSLTLRTRASGAKPLFYQWIKDGEPIPGATTPKFVLQSTSATDAGSYSVVVSNVVSTVTSTPALVVIQ